MGSQVKPGQGNFMPPYGGGTINESTYNSGPYVQNPGMPSMGTGGGFAPGMGGGGIYPGAGPGVGWQPGMGGGLSGGGQGAVKAVMPYPGMPNGVGGYPSYDPGMFNPGGGGGMTQPGFPSNPTIAPQFPGMGGVTQPGFPSNPGMAPPAPINAPAPAPAPANNPFAGVSAGRLAEAQRFADMGKMGRAKQQVQLGGGTWNPAMHRAFRGGGTGG